MVPPRKSKGRFRKGHDPRRHAFTSEERSRGGNKSKHNLAAPFQTGFDPRRHALTQEECQKGGQQGFETVMNERPEVLLWLKKKLKRQGRYKKGGRSG